MRRLFIIAGLAVLAMGCIQKVERKPDSFDEKKVAAACELIIAGFQTELTKELVVALGEGGPENAIKVCAVKAPEIADRISHMPGIDIRRVSLQMRNPNIVPDLYEVSVLRKFAETPREDPQSASVMARDSGEVKRFRYMKEIKVGQLCLGCHGNPAGLSAAMKKALAQQYPNDRALGYSLGASRGAYSMTVTYPAARETVTKVLSDVAR